MSKDLSYLVPFAETPTQKAAIRAILENGSYRKAAAALKKSSTAVVQVINSLKAKAGKMGVAPQEGMNHPVIQGFTTKRVSTAYNSEGEIALQWHIQQPEKESLDELVKGIRDAFVADLKPCKPVPAPKTADEELACCYNIGDHHFGMYAWADETGSADYDTEISEKLLRSAAQKLISRAPKAETGYLVNLGDFLHANDSTSQTPSSKHALDTDGRMGRVGRKAGLLIRSLVELMLRKHRKVVVINSRGNHDPDASLWLNEVCRAYFINEPRVEVLDNFNKFVWFTFGKNLVVTHHGDKIKWQQMYEAVTRNLHKEWGECRYRYGWTGHLHHEESKEIGGMKFQRWGVLAPPDAWHSGSGYGAQRTMSCVVLHKEYGRDSVIEVNVDEL